MEIFGGFMVMISIIGFFLAVVWLVMPFVVFAIKGKQDRSLELLERLEKQLAQLDDKVTALQHSARQTTSEPAGHTSDDAPPALDSSAAPSSS